MKLLPSLKIRLNYTQTTPDSDIGAEDWPKLLPFYLPLHNEMIEKRQLHIPTTPGQDTEQEAVTHDASLSFAHGSQNKPASKKPTHGPP